MQVFVKCTQNLGHPSNHALARAIRVHWWQRSCSSRSASATMRRSCESQQHPGPPFAGETSVLATEGGCFQCKALTHASSKNTICKCSNMPLSRRVTLFWRITSFTMRNTITEDKLTNTFASGDKTTGDAPTARTGLALCHRVTLDSVAHWWVPARTPTDKRQQDKDRPRVKCAFRKQVQSYTWNLTAKSDTTSTVKTSFNQSLFFCMQQF